MYIHHKFSKTLTEKSEEFDTLVFENIGDLLISGNLVHDQESADIDGDRLFIVAIENVKVVQNVKIHDLKTIVTMIFI